MWLRRWALRLMILLKYYRLQGGWMIDDDPSRVPSDRRSKSWLDGSLSISLGLFSSVGPLIPSPILMHAILLYIKVAMSE
jgi:hypothetical protein